jgi:predicted cytidylate kinase
LLLTISGLPGSGTSTVAREVAQRLGIERLDGGEVFRAMAAERGLSLAEFGRVAEADPGFDAELDGRLADRARAGDVVLESRLAGWIATNEGLVALRVWLACDDEERARRVGVRDGESIADALATNRDREASEAARYAAYYGIDIGDLSIYDLVIDTTATPPEACVEQILDAADARR